MQWASKHNKQTEHMQNSVYLRSIIASRTCVQAAVIRIPYIIKQMCIKVLYNTTLSHHMCWWYLKYGKIALDYIMEGKKYSPKVFWSRCVIVWGLLLLSKHEFLIKLLKKVQRWIKHFIIHVHDLSLIKIKWGCDSIMAASPRNRSVFLLWSMPEGCVHLSERLLGPDKTALFRGLREARSGSSSVVSILSLYNMWNMQCAMI